VPELPEVETVRRQLAAALTGGRVIQARLNRRDICETPDRRRTSPRDLLEGQVIAGFERRGKQLAVVADSGRILVVHLGMSGQLLLLGPGERPSRTNHIHAEWRFDNERRLAFRDPRRFGGLWTLTTRAALEARWESLGPDGLEASGGRLAGAAGRSRRAIKAVLLDQAVLAGVGNIYADEALFRAGVSPRRPACRLSTQDWSNLANAIRRTLRDAIDARGSTLRDYVAADGSRGNAQVLHRVYGRQGQACLNCGRRLRGLRLAQRATVYCPACQH
jgi:formamidopyrimidine-DNA glycosylase